MKKCVFAILVTSILIFTISMLTGCSGKRTLDFQTIAEFKFIGLNGKGEVITSIKSNIYENEIFLERLFPNSSAKKGKEKLAELMKTVDYTFSESNNLTNGDEITVSVDYDEELFTDKEVKTKNTEFKIKVNGLSDGTKIDVFDGLKVTYEGMSGKGYANFDSSNCCDFVQNYVTFGYSKDKLSNGDKIDVTAIYSEENANSELVIIENNKKEFTVSGLQEPIEIDPFEKLAITYTGASPYIKVAVDSTKCDSMVNQYIIFNVEDKYLSNGDTFTVTAVYNEYDAEENGFIVKNDIKTYTVGKLSEYVTSLDGLELKDLQSEIDDKLSVVTSAKDGDSKFANVYLDGRFDSITSKKLKSQYLISLKTSFEDKFNNGWNSYNYNRYLQIYEYNVKSIIHYSEPEMRQNKVYVLVYVNNIQKNADGTISWDIELQSTSSDNYDNLIKDYVTSEKEYYNVSEIKDKDE